MHCYNTIEKNHRVQWKVYIFYKEGISNEGEDLELNSQASIYI